MGGKWRFPFRLGVILVCLLGLLFIKAGCAGDDETIINNYTQDDPFDTNWSSSGHADSTAEAFRHWDGDTPPEVSTSCARCHSTAGYIDFVGGDGSPAGTVEVAPPAATNNGIECDACHNDASWALTSVTFDSGATITDLGHEAICMQCHQGRKSTSDVDNEIANANPAPVDDDTPQTGTIVDSLSFQNIHYYAAGATRYGSEVQGGYQYSGNSYQGLFAHAPGMTACMDCHDQHTLAVQVEACGQCHDGITDLASLRTIRTPGSWVDYDGDGNTSEGIAAEIDGLRTTLYSAIQDYASANPNTVDIYYVAHHPYWFDDSAGTTRYSTWTNRLLKATYNYQYALKDPGAFAHNAKYLIQILYDSIQDLDSSYATVPGLASMVRDDGGHFDPLATHWGYAGTRPSCSKCHNAEGFNFFIESGGLQPLTLLEKSDGLTCDVCHDNTDYKMGSAPRKRIYSVTFPGGASVNSSSGAQRQICMTCHSGRESGADVDADIAANDFHFLNVHYFPAGAVLLGSDVHVGYEYAGQTYERELSHNGDSNSEDCVYCHQGGHDFHVSLTGKKSCGTCHSAATVQAIRLNRGLDYDGDGSSTENLVDEISTLVTDQTPTNVSLAQLLYAEIQLHATNQAGTPIVYSPTSYPYFFVDANNDGLYDAGDTTSYDAWDAALMRSCFNLQISQKDPGAWAHNTIYIAQLLYDSMNDLRPGSVSTLTRAN